MKVNGVFVTGTDTGVGKTVVAATLLSIFRKAGIDAAPMKPVQTGCRREKDGWCVPDLEFCLDCAGLDPAEEEEEWMAPYCFEPACSPHLAAEQAEVTISLDHIEESFKSLRRKHDLVVVEGAGGVLVPVARDKTMLDVMVRLNLPVVLVSRLQLGTINHSLLSIRELMRAGLRIVGVVTNDVAPTAWGDIEEDNCETIERLGRVTILGHVKHMPAIRGGRITPESFHAAVREFLPPAHEIVERMSV